MTTRFTAVALLAVGLLAAVPVSAEVIGKADTAFKLIGRNHQVVVEAFDDPKVKGVTCFVSMARKGGLSGTLGLAEGNIGCIDCLSADRADRLHGADRCG